MDVVVAVVRDNDGELCLCCFATGPWTGTDDLRFREIGIVVGHGKSGSSDRCRLPNWDVL